MKQVSENPLAKQAPTRRRPGEEDGMETRILELSINKICRWKLAAQRPAYEACVPVHVPCFGRSFKMSS